MSIVVASLNANRQNPVISTVLSMTTADILMIQEPWWGKIGVRRSDSDPEGVPVKGHVAHPNWDCHAPPGPDRPKVIFYTRKSIGCLITTIDDACSHTFFGLLLSFTHTTFQLLNFYHEAPRSGPRHGLGEVLGWGDDGTPTVLAGDFNTHSPSWSPAGLTTSPWARPLEEWMDREGFHNLIAPGTVTRMRGQD
jgi:hypothetical protein